MNVFQSEKDLGLGNQESDFLLMNCFIHWMLPLLDYRREEKR